MSIKNKKIMNVNKFVIKQNEFIKESELYEFDYGDLYDTLDQKIEILDRSGVIDAADWNSRLAA